MTKTVQGLDGLRQLRSLTPARIGLSRAGSSIATREVLKFDRDHARARDAVHLPFDAKGVANQLAARGIRTVLVQSAAADRSIYLQRPDLGRRLDERSRRRLESHRTDSHRQADIAIVIADGLSSRAIHENAVAFLDLFLPLATARGWRWAPTTIASQARVAIADEIGEILAVRLSVILIGERPGLSASDSMGIYLTHGPRPGRTDAERNCISNIRPAGLSCREAAGQLDVLIASAFAMRLSGVHLKPGSMPASLSAGVAPAKGADGEHPGVGRPSK